MGTFSYIFIFFLQQVVNHPQNRGIISKLCDLTAPESVTSFRSRTIHFSCLLAFHLMHLNPVKLNVGTSRRLLVGTSATATRDISSASTSSSNSPSKTSWSPSRRKRSLRKKKKKAASNSTITAANAKKKLF